MNDERLAASLRKLMIIAILTAWAACKGPQGDVGPQGTVGPAGTTGAQGSQGAAGPTGTNGAQGSQGATGPAGASGAQGSQGVPGPTGATGAQGSPGAAGTAGATGAQGTQGVPGSANIFSSAWITAKAADWRSDNDPQYFYVAFDEQKITQAILDKGLVMAYYRDPGRKNVVLSLPSAADGVNLGFFFQFFQNKGTVNFDLSYAKPRLTPIDFDLEFRWIIVPPNPGGRRAAVDWKNYEEVRRMLNLVD